MNIANIFKQIAFEEHFLRLDQRRKYTGQAYTIHTNEVASIYASYFPEDFVGQAACHGHDLLEDTAITPGGIHARVNELAIDGETDPCEVTRTLLIISDLTDIYTSENFPKLKRHIRKGMERDRIARVSDTAQNIKCCDMLSNTASIVEHDKDFARIYLDEKCELIKVMTGADHRLLARIITQCIRAKIQLEL